MLKRSTLREIKNSLGRYLAIIAIVALGVGFFAGLRVTKTAMVKTADKFLSESNFFDYNLVSTLGYDDEGLSEVSSVPGVLKATGAISADVLCQDGSRGDMVVTAISLTPGINDVKLMSGRMPASPNECVVDFERFSSDDIGTELVLSGENDEDTKENFAYANYTIVGTCVSPLYINYERGSTSLGNGTVAGFVCLLPEGFAADYYTDIYLKLEKTGYLYSDEYERNIAAMEDAVTSAASIAAVGRYERVLSDAEHEISDGKVELSDAKREYEDKKLEVNGELADARAELEDARRKLDDGWSDYYEGIITFNTEIADAETEISDGEADLSDAYAELLEGEEEYADGVLELESGIMQYEDGLKKYKEGVAAYEDGLAEYEDGARELEDARIELSFARGRLEDAEAQYAEGKAGFDALITGIVGQLSLMGVTVTNDELLAALLSGDPALTAMTDGILAGMAGAGVPELPTDSAALLGVKAQLDSSAQKISDGWSSYRSGVRKYESGKEELNEAKKALDLNKARLDSAKIDLDDAKTEIDDGRTELKDARQELTDGWDDYREGVQELADAKVTLADEREKGQRKLDDARTELVDGEREYTDGLKEYNDGKAEADRKFAEAEQKITDAEEELSDAEKELRDLKRPTVHALDRDTNIGYACFENDSSIVQAVSSVFPVFFFLVAALVCVTTMARMIEEQRTQIGVFKALGYSNGAIMGKYMFYSGSAAFLGCFSGFFLGSIIFPKVLWMAYSIMYDFGTIMTVFDPFMALGSFAVCIIGALGVTWLSCRAEFNEVPAELIRPKAPKIGKRVLLEYVPFIWNRLKFLHKVSIRNLLRYKKRFFMMILGISGCTALLLTGFGIDDSIGNLTDYQYTEVTVYDCAVTFSDPLTAQSEQKFLNECNDAVGSAVFVHESSVDVSFGSVTKSVNLVVSPQSLDGYINMVSVSGAPIEMPKAGEAVINNGLARAMRLSVGDTITVRDSDLNEASVTVSGIYKNYVNNYIFISPEMYASSFGVCDYKSAYVNTPDSVDNHAAAAKILKAENVAAVSVGSDMRDRIGSMMSSMDYIVLLVIVCAGALAFIVLYNLTNINITERMREIATLKVLGFYSNETASYVFRENMMLTGLGALAGLFIGICLHSFVMNKIVVDSVCFDVRIAPLSYMWSVLLTFAFSVAVSLFMRVKLDKINMAESLKSIE